MTDTPGSDWQQAQLAVYLNDHLAGATGGIDLFRWVAGEHHGTAYGEALARLADEVGEERQALLEIMTALDISVRHYKMAGGWVAEKLVRFTVHGGLKPRSPLSSVLELEALHLAVLGKRAAWRLLRMVAETDPRLDAARLDALAARADQQSVELEQLRMAAARGALVR